MQSLLLKVALIGLIQNNFGLTGKRYKDLRENGIGTCEETVLGLARKRYWAKKFWTGENAVYSAFGQYWAI